MRYTGRPAASSWHDEIRKEPVRWNRQATVAKVPEMNGFNRLGKRVKDRPSTLKPRLRGVGGWGRMGFLTRFLGALVLTYYTRRAFAALLPKTIGLEIVLVLSNVLSFLTWALVAGLVKTFVAPINIEAGLIYIFPQLVWLAWDLWRASARRR